MEKKNKRPLPRPLKLLIFHLILFTGIAGGWFAHSTLKKVQTQNTGIRQSGYQYINPLLECEVEEAQALKELSPFKDKLIRKINEITSSGRANSISIYFRDLNNGPWIGIGEKEAFSPASLAKVPLMISYLLAVERDRDILEKELTYKTIVDNEGNPIDPLTSLENGKNYTIEELIKRMIIFSDNSATDILSKNIGEELFEKPYKDFELPIPTLETQNYTLTVRQYASFFRILYNASYLGREMSEYALSILSESDFKDGLERGIPPNVSIAHKYGRRVLSSNLTQLHDCGIIYYPNHPYLLCIMTKGTDSDDLPGTIGELSLLVYNEIHSQFKE